jgi:hypothetical protein
MIVQMLIMSPYFYVGSVWGKMLFDDYKKKGIFSSYHKHLVGYLCFMAGLILVFIALSMVGGGNDD